MPGIQIYYLWDFKWQWKLERHLNSLLHFEHTYFTVPWKCCTCWAKPFLDRNVLVHSAQARHLFVWKLRKCSFKPWRWLYSLPHPLWGHFSFGAWCSFTMWVASKHELRNNCSHLVHCHVFTLGPDLWNMHLCLEREEGLLYDLPQWQWNEAVSPDPCICRESVKIISIYFIPTTTRQDA